MPKRPVARLALSCMLSWSMIMSGFVPVASALAEEPAVVAAAYSEQAFDETGAGEGQDGASEDPAYDEQAADSADAGQTEGDGQDGDSSAAADTDASDASDDGSAADAADSDAVDGDSQDSQDSQASTDKAAGAQDASDKGDATDQDAQKTPADGTADAANASNSDGQASQDAAEAQPAALVPEAALSLVYVAQSSIAQGQTEQVAFILADESAQVSTASLTLLAPAGEVAVDAAAGDGSALLFNLDTDALGQGTTTLAGLALTYADGTTATVDLTQGQDVYSFEVTEAVEAQQADNGITAYTIDDSGELVEASSLDAALEASGAQEAVTAALTAASDDEASAQSTTTGLVIALDPGHDNQAPGSYGYGLNEEDLNLAIAKACRAELQTYPGVTVYMTRPDNGDCPYYSDGNHDESSCLKRRVQDAAAAGATIVVSIHINSSDASSAHGVEVWYPSYNAGDTAITADGQKLAESIQKRLVALGLTDRGAKSNDTFYDDDGVERDYYSIIRNSKALSMPGVIIEHAFITSGTDYAYLSDSSMLQQMGIADATGIADFLGLSKTKDNSNISLTRLTVADTDGRLGQATLRATGVKGAQRYYAQVKYADGKTDTVEFGQSDEGVWFGTYDFSKTGRVVENVTITGYKVDTAGKTTQVGRWEGTLKRFTDLEVGAWYLSYVSDVASDGIITGYTDEDGVTRRFGPEDTLTRGQVATMLWRLAGSPDASGTSMFKDVPSGQFYSTAVQWASRKGIVNGDTDRYGNLTGTFRPNDAVTREELATMLYRYATKAGFGSGSANIWKFPDAGSVTTYARDAVAWCNAKGIITGDQATYPARLNPQNTATRAQAAKMLSVFSDCAGGLVPQADEVFEVTDLSCRLSDEAKGVTFYTPAGEVSSSGAVNIKVWKSGSSSSSAATYAATYVAKGTTGENSDLVGCWAVTVPLSKMSSGNYTAQVWASSTATGAKKAFASTEVSTNLHPIMNSKSKVTASTLVSAYKASGATYPASTYKAKGAATIEQFCKILVEEAKAEGVDPGVVFVQAMTETGWLRFGGDVKAEQCNFAGIGATGGGAAGATFSSVREGLRAQVQHLRLYADSTCTSASKLANTLVDPRFFTSLAGVSPYVEGLGSRWASGSSYGWGLAAMLDEL